MVTFESRITLKYDFIQSTKISSAIQQHTGTTAGNGVRGNLEGRSQPDIIVL